MKTWIQHYDLCIEELDCVSVEDLLFAYNGHEWGTELKKEEEDQGSDRCCRPAFGIEMDEHHTIQLYPKKGKRIDLHYDYTVMIRKWGLFLDYKTVFLDVKDIGEENLDEILYLHCNKEHTLLLEFLEAFGQTKILGA